MTSLLDQAAALRYLRALTGEDDPVVCVQCFDDTAAKRPGLAYNRTGRISWLLTPLVASNAQQAGVFVTVNQTDGGGRKVENVTALRALFVDCDGTRELPTEWMLHPSLIVQRGPRHWHAYWLLVPGEDLARFTHAQKQLATYWGTDLGVSDLPRVMRIPGFVHHKGEPTAVRLVHESGERHTIDQVLAAYPAEVVDRTKATVSRETSAPRIPGGKDDELFRNWAAKVETSKGGAVGRGRDTSAFYIACEGVGRFREGRISMSTVHAVVLDYARRAGLPNPEADAARVIASAERKPHIETHAGPDLSQRRERAPARDQGRMQQAPAADEDLFGSGAGDGGGSGGGDEPPAAAADDGEEPEDKPFSGLDTDRLKWRWAIGDRGVCPVEMSADGSYVARPNKRVAGLPIWPERAGSDVASGATWWKLAWWTPNGETRMQWVSEGDMKLGHPLIALPDAPVTKRQAENCAVYLTEARACVTQERAEVTSRIGWCGVNGSRRWVFPGVGVNSQVEYIGGALPSHGKLDGWKGGLAYLLSDNLKGDQAYTALAVVCLSAAAPWSRLMGSRNPIIGLMGPSSSGKGSAIDYALAIWADADLMRLPASSTAKGIQDRAIQLPDLPIMLDELQQLTELHPHATADALYFLANGQRRVTSSKERTSTGGERRYGVGFYAAEAPVLPGQNLGVLYRVIELDGRPCPDEATAKALQAGSKHTGTLAGPLAEILGSKDVTAWVEDVHKRAAELRTAQGGLTGDDPEALALIELGAEVLGKVTGLTLPTCELIEWLAKRVRAQRSNVVDRETQCLHQVMSTVLNQSWFEYGEKPDDAPIRKNHINIQGRPLAWRSYTAQGTTDKLDVDSLHREVQPLFQAHGGEPRVLKQWADRGWIERQGPHLKVRRRDAGRVVRFTLDAWKAFNGSAPDQEADAP